APDTSTMTAMPAAAHVVPRRCLDNTTGPLYPPRHQRIPPRTCGAPSGVRGATCINTSTRSPIGSRRRGVHPARASGGPGSSGGRGGGPVGLRRLGELVVRTGGLERPAEANARTLALPHDVVASTLDAAGTLPFRFGVVVAATGLEPWLAAHAPLVNTTLAQL